MKPGPGSGPVLPSVEDAYRMGRDYTSNGWRWQEFRRVRAGAEGLPRWMCAGFRPVAKALGDRSGVTQSFGIGIPIR
jgi:hypothetical protein